MKHENDPTEIIDKAIMSDEWNLAKYIDMITSCNSSLLRSLQSSLQKWPNLSHWLSNMSETQEDNNINEWNGSDKNKKQNTGNG